MGAQDDQDLNPRSFDLKLSALAIAIMKWENTGGQLTKNWQVTPNAV